MRACVRPGIDLIDMAGDLLQPDGDDTARISWNLRKNITKYQDTFSVIERVCLTYDDDDAENILFLISVIVSVNGCSLCAL